jgi:DNA-directed RNA polymerase subunit K
MQKEFSKYENARILGARALQIAMNAPLLIKISNDDLEKINFDAIKIAEIELESNVLPISVNKPLPKKNEEALKRTKDVKLSEKDVVESEKEEEKDIAEKGEIMELANPEDETDDGTESGDQE